MEEWFFVLHFLLHVKQWQHKNYLPLWLGFDGNMELTFGFEAPICSARAFFVFLSCHITLNHTHLAYSAFLCSLYSPLISLYFPLIHVFST